MNNWISLLALGAPPPAGTEQNPKAQMLNMVLMFGAMGVMFYFLLIRPQSKQRKDQENLLANIKSGDEVLTSGGIYGIVTNVKDKEIMLKIADNVKIRVAKSAIATVVKKSNEIDVTETK
jgi:preprotein translocase subunit YajC